MNEDRATRYHRLKRRALVLSLAWSAILFTALLVTGASLQLRETAERTASAIGRSSPAVVVILFVAGLILLHEAGSFIIALYSGFIVEHRSAEQDSERSRRTPLPRGPREPGLQ